MFKHRNGIRMDKVTQPANAYKRLRIGIFFFEHTIPHARFGNTCDQPQGSALQRIYCKRFFNQYRNGRY